MLDIPEEIERQVLKRAGNRCEGEVDPSGRMKRTERCTAKKDLDLYVCFSAQMAGEPLRASDVTLLCEACYDNSETSEQWAHLNYMISKDD
jgi:hypothetical protein